MVADHNFVNIHISKDRMLKNGSKLSLDLSILNTTKGEYISSISAAVSLLENTLKELNPSTFR